jgi:hypothetical protein
MIGQELITHMRESILDDIVLPYLWSDTELLRFLNYAEVQACRRAHLLIDGSTGNDNGTAATASTAGQRPLCTLTVVANQAAYTLSRLILQVKRCQLQSMTIPLVGPVTYPELDDVVSGWMGTGGLIGTAGSGGSPTYYLNEPGNTVTFVLAPSAGDIANLVVSRLPLSQFTLQTSPEIDDRYHVDLCDWAAHLAYNKPDSDTLNLNLSAFYEKKFTATFGPLPDAYSERMRKTIAMQERMRPRTFGD